MTQAQLAEKADLFTPTISHFENRNLKAGPKRRHRLAIALGVSEADIFDRLGWPLADRDYCCSVVSTDADLITNASPHSNGGSRAIEEETNEDDPGK